MSDETIRNLPTGSDSPARFVMQRLGEQVQRNFVLCSHELAKVPVVAIVAVVIVHG